MTELKFDARKVVKPQVVVNPLEMQLGAEAKKLVAMSPFKFPTTPKVTN